MGRRRRIKENNVNQTNFNNDSSPTVFGIIISKLKTLDLMDIVKSIIVPIIIAYGVVDYQMDNQVILDKQATAKQLSIEIESLNPNLQEYASYYHKGFDLDLNGDNPAIEPGVDNFFIVSNKNSSSLPVIMKVNKTGYYLDHLTIKSLHNGVGEYSFPNIYPPNVVFFATLDTPIIPPPLYNEHGLYYLYAKDISAFDKTVAQDLYLFYTEIAKAESDRVFLQTYFSTYGYENEFNEQYFNTYMDMRLNILNAAAIAPRVLDKLDNETE